MIIPTPNTLGGLSVTIHACPKILHELSWQFSVLKLMPQIIIISWLLYGLQTLVHCPDRPLVHQLVCALISWVWEK